MNATERVFRSHGGAPTQSQKFLNCLMEAQGQWVSLLVLVGAGSGYAAHSRAADCRKLGYNIENRVVFNKQTRQRESFYRIVA